MLPKQLLSVFGLHPSLSQQSFLCLPLALTLETSTWLPWVKLKATTKATPAAIKLTFLSITLNFGLT